MLSKQAASSARPNFTPSFLPFFLPSLPPSSFFFFLHVFRCHRLLFQSLPCRTWDGRRGWGGLGRGLPCHRDFAVITVDLPCCGGGAKVGDVADFFLATWSRTKSAGCKGGGNCVSVCQCCTIAALLNTCIDCGADSTVWFRPPSLLSVVWSRGIVEVVVFFFSSFRSIFWSSFWLSSVMSLPYSLSLSLSVYGLTLSDRL